MMLKRRGRQEEGKEEVKEKDNGGKGDRVSRQQKNIRWQSSLRTKEASFEVPGVACSLSMIESDGECHESFSCQGETSYE